MSLFSNHPDEVGITLIMLILQKDLQIINANGIMEETANELIEAALFAISEHPELVSGRTDIQNIISGVATSLTKEGIDQPPIIFRIYTISFKTYRRKS